MTTLVHEPIQRQDLAATRLQPVPETPDSARLGRALLASLRAAGDFVLGIVLWLTGIVVQLALVVGAVLAVPVALILAVLLFSLLILGVGEVLRALGLS
jgi:hypothetical protein